MDEAPLMDSPIEERPTPSFFTQHKFTIISVLVLVLALIPLIILTQGHKNVTPVANTTAQTEITPTPTTQPITQQNAEPTIDATDQQIQQALDESQTEINAVNQINTSADSTTGL